MKKFISIVLAIIMAFSVSVTAFAATSTVKAGVKKTATLTAEVEKDYVFTAEENGIYKLQSKILSDGDVYVTIYNKSNILNATELYTYSEDPDSESYGMEKSELYFCAGEGSVLTIEFYTFSTDYLPETTKVEFTVSKSDSPEIKLGKNTAAKNGTIFLFIPDKSGYYNFRSTAASNVDPYISVSDVNGDVDFNHDSGLPDDLNFDLTLKLTKGKVYAIECVPDEYEDSVKKSFSFTVSFNKKTEIEYLDVYAPYTYDEPVEKLVLCNGDSEYLYIDAAPYGALPTSEIEVYVNGNSAYIEQFESPYEFLLYTNRIGKTTITVISDSGIEREVNVVVLPHFFGVIRDTFQTISYFFQSIFNRGEMMY